MRANPHYAHNDHVRRNVFDVLSNESEVQCHLNDAGAKPTLVGHEETGSTELYSYLHGKSSLLPELRSLSQATQ